MSKTLRHPSEYAAINCDGFFVDAQHTAVQVTSSSILYVPLNVANGVIIVLYVVFSIVIFNDTNTTTYIHNKYLKKKELV